MTFNQLAQRDPVLAGQLRQQAEINEQKIGFTKKDISDSLARRDKIDSTRTRPQTHFHHNATSAE